MSSPELQGYFGDFCDNVMLPKFLVPERGAVFGAPLSLQSHGIIFYPCCPCLPCCSCCVSLTYFSLRPLRKLIPATTLVAPVQTGGFISSFGCLLSIPSFSQGLIQLCHFPVDSTQAPIFFSLIICYMDRHQLPPCNSEM